jgi:hypothetical protein
MSTPRARIKSGKASLIGGIVVGIATFILWMVIAGTTGPAWLPLATPLGTALGAIVAVAVGTWIRLADL